MMRVIRKVDMKKVITILFNELSWRMK